MHWWKRPHVRIGKYSFYLWAGCWSWPLDKQECHCHSVAWYLGPFGFEIANACNPEWDNDENWIEVSRPS